MDTDSTEETSSDYSTESSEEDGMETAEINGYKIQLPQGLCERKDIFHSVLSSEMWDSLNVSNKRHLGTFLPNFPENDEEEKKKTLQKLFDCETFRFNSPLEKFHEDLKAGYFRPDIANMRKIIKKAQTKEARYRYKKFREKLKQDVIESQRKLINQINNLPPGIEPKIEKNQNPNLNFITYRTKRRYYQILSSIRAKTEDSSCSPDENYPEGPPVALSRKQRRHLNGIKNSYSSDVYVSTMATKSNGLDLEKYITPLKNPFYINDDTYRNLLYQHKRRKLENSQQPEYNTKGITLSDIVNRTQLPYVKNANPKDTKITKKKKIRQGHSSTDLDTDSEVEKVVKVNKKVTKNDVKREPTVISGAKIETIKTASFHDLETIDMMEIPIDFDNSEIELKPELMQETHSNFLSLIRDIVCSTNEHRMNLATLEERLKSWQENPISPLNDWYSLTDNWLFLLKSAIIFLCGNSTDQPDDFVPYMEYKISLDMYQWIGAGRDSDLLLAPLCQYWLEHRSDVKTTSTTKEDNDVEVSDRSQTPPPPRCPTNWTVRKATNEEIKEFREQERKRYDNPHKAFTYRCNGYESVVGPLKGIYNPSVGNTKARGHTMLNADRPNFVTILSLVRDATARLPNGEGTRSDICELLKSSQYISNSAPDNILQSVVSGALDRMHTQFDPCVKYDPKRKIWIYLHRNRNEEDFERIHQQYQNVTKNKKNASKKVQKTTKTKKNTGGSELKQTNQEQVQHTEDKEINEALQTIVKKTTPPKQINQSLLQQKPKTVNQKQEEKIIPIKNVTLVRGGGDNKIAQATLTPAQQQQILQTIKQKILPQQQIILKQKQQTKIEGTKTSNPVVAKVLTNAAGQVISVESLLAHQKQHGSLPQGTTLRVSGTKPNIIQIAGPTTKQNPITQFTNNLIINQPKLVAVTTPTTTVTVTTPPALTTTASAPRQTISTAKFPTKIAQQLINAKLINQVKTKNLTLTSNTIRMVNAANLNLTHIGGKPVLLASKGSTIHNVQGQNVILQTQATTSGGSLVLQKPQQNVVLTPQLKVQTTPQQVVFSSVKTVANQISQGHIVLEGHPVRLQTSTATNTQRVVLASQGQGGQIVAQQILLPAGFQGTAINIKALQGVKVIPLAQAHQGRGVQGRQVFARVMNPAVVKATTSVAQAEKTTDPTITSSE